MVALNKLQRCCGPEPEMQFYQDVKTWEERVGRMRRLIREGWDMQPLIVESTHDMLMVSDGNARHEALRREGADACWAIIWGSDGPMDQQQLTQPCRDTLHE